MSILGQLADHARVRTERAKQQLPLPVLQARSAAMPRGTFAFETALKRPNLSFICECKKASPSKGLIAEEFPYLQIARDYEAAGADCISVLTEPKWFLGSDRFLQEIAETVSIPCLRKDFTVDTDNSQRLRQLVPSDVLFVSESGVKDRTDVQRLQDLGADAVLIGETLMRAPDKKARLLELKGML